MDEDQKPMGAIVWTDLTVENADALRDFYCEVAGWTYTPNNMDGYEDYNMVVEKNGEAVAGVCHARGANSNLPAQWLNYVSVEDVDSSARRAIELGGRVVDGPRKMGNNRFCVVEDPAGAVIALISQ